MSPGKSLFLGALGRIDFLEGPITYFTVFVSNGVKLHPTDIEKADGAFIRHYGSILQPPFQPKRRTQLPPMESHDFEIELIDREKATIDVAFSGLGWIALTGKELGKCSIRCYAPQGVVVELRPPLLPMEAKAERRKMWGVKKHGRAGPSPIPAKDRKPSDVQTTSEEEGEEEEIYEMESLENEMDDENHTNNNNNNNNEEQTVMNDSSNNEKQSDKL
jgi:hypothetical protein